MAVRIKQGGVYIEHIPTGKTRSNVLINPKQGKYFSVSQINLMDVPKDFRYDKEKHDKVH